MVQLDHFDSGNTITPENDDTCEVSRVPPACPHACPTRCPQHHPAALHTIALCEFLPASSTGGTRSTTGTLKPLCLFPEPAFSLCSSEETLRG